MDERTKCILRKNYHDSRYTIPDFKTGLKPEVEATEFFTRNIFFDIQSEILASMVSCMLIRLEESEELKTFCSTCFLTRRVVGPTRRVESGY
uniref:Uncharacterized protein n=1 Tax=Lactuca sativa TaxID=4236 RepID=A0A9R1XTR4_LACSA|nr:hypothetical protein LSAT_V11C300134320 [Lactuca sativa]